MVSGWIWAKLTCPGSYRVILKALEDSKQLIGCHCRQRQNFGREKNERGIWNTRMGEMQCV
jgi:hypothetical protein